MKRFSYHEPETVSEVFDLLKELGKGAKLLAGGTDLLVQMKRGVISPEYLINLKRINELKSYSIDEENISLGPLTSLRAIEKEKFFRENCSVLANTAAQMASPQIRYLATIGGNLCNASPSADMAPPLIALGSSVVLAGQEGSRKVILEEFFQGPGNSVLDDKELMTQVIVPTLKPTARACYLKHSFRKAHDIALVGAAVMLDIGEDGTTVKEAKIVLGAVAPTPIRALAAETILKHEKINQHVISEAARLAVDAATPIDDIRTNASYRKKIVEVLVARALKQLLPEGRIEYGNANKFKSQWGVS